MLDNMTDNSNPLVDQDQKVVDTEGGSRMD
jgi:hypothetical protein